MSTSIHAIDGPATDTPRSDPRLAFRVRNVSKVFVGQSNVHAVHDVSVDLEAGSFTCIVGPSGCGKSTLLRMLGGLEKPTLGTIESEPTSGKLPPAAFVFQEHGIFPWLSVLENVAFGLRMAGVSRGEREATAKRWLGYVGLEDFANSYPHQLSGGMKQRAAIARAFVTGSPTLLMDEPLGALDAQTRRLMQEQLIELWERDRKTVVLVTHAIDEALLLGDRIVLMSARPGQIKESIEVPFTHPRRPDLETHPEFVDMKQAIWESLREEVERSVQHS
ncbi:ABC transporter ATP-binding protein [Nocardioides immobilis]|uniref:ABC transporter ATP-binding protein n=1 Tax=Nocardioides immobilis TaxID=2049295 RepID=A0A417Y9G9_9ACTN|nr:ABC transporter ATP-binding protein [Nocardioides immobilis]RHW29167.1 ABC transporter ATP-binding protein [Nocardioides immobilis]